MEYWKKGYVENGTGSKGILLKKNDRILSLSKTQENEVQIIEECDGYFGLYLKKKDAIKLFEEAIEWINKEII